jgi:hypothetical protein
MDLYKLSVKYLKGDYVSSGTLALVVVVLIIALFVLILATTSISTLGAGLGGVTASVSDPVGAPSPPWFDGCPLRVDCDFLPGDARWEYCSCPAGCRVTGQYGYACTRVHTALGYPSFCGVTKGYDNRVAFLIDNVVTNETAHVGVWCEKMPGGDLEPIEPWPLEPEWWR